jgi:hypothetical protein
MRLKLVDQIPPHQSFLCRHLVVVTSDIAQVACRVMPWSSDFARWTSIFRPNRRLQARKLLEQDGSDREASAPPARGGVYQRG